MREHDKLADTALIEMGDFVGTVLKYMRRAPAAKLSLAGSFGKISKLAAGHLDLHSRKSSIDMAMLAREAGRLGAEQTLQTAIINANTSQQALALASEAGPHLGDRICALALKQARKTASVQVTLAVWSINRQGKPIGYAG